MEIVLGEGVELWGDWAVVGGDEWTNSGRVNRLYAASVAGGETVVKKFFADIIFAADDRYAWGEDKTVAGIREGGGYRLWRSKHPNGAMHGMIVHKSFLPEGRGEQDRETDGVLIMGSDTVEKALARWLKRYTPLPFLDHWLCDLWTMAKQAGLITELDVLGRKDIVAALVRRNEERWLGQLQRGIKDGIFTIPDNPEGANGDPLDTVEDLDGYLKSWAPALAERSQKMHPPLWDPAAGEERGPALGLLKEPLFPAQADVAEGLARSLKHRKGIFVDGTMGTGKTRIGAAIAYRTLAHKGGFRVLVQCPKHLLKKWVREVEAVVPGAKAQIVWSGKEMLQLLPRLRATKPTGPEFYIIARDTAKLGWFYRHGAVARTKAEVVNALDEKTGRRVRQVLHKQVWCCPKCGQVLADEVKEDGAEEGERKPWEPERMDSRRADNGVCPSCQEPLWQADGRRVRRCSIAWAVRHKGKGIFDLLVADEVHELKGGDTAQGVALGTMAAMCKKVVLLTGTLFGGMALDVFYLLWRISPGQMLADGQEYREPGKWVAMYGRTEREITGEDEGGDANAASRSGWKRGSPRMRPGISPVLFGRHLLDSVAFIDLEDVAPWLPRYTEIPDPVTMNDEMRKAYTHLSARLETEARALAAHGDLSMFAVWQQVGLGWPDKPGSWPDVTSRGEYVCTPPVVTPDGDGLYPKEKRLLEVLRHERARGRKCAIYQTFTGRHDMLARLEEITRGDGFHPAVLRAEQVNPEDREEWIAQKLRSGADLLLCHPKVVETGLDLYAFPTIIWLQTGTSLFPVRQASRRSYRIGQTEDVEVRFLAYEETLQTAALMLMAKKMQAATAAEGSVTVEGLRAMAGDDDGSEALRAALLRGMDGLQTAEAMWKAAAVLSQVAAPAAPGEPKIQTLTRMVAPVVAVAPKTKRGQKAASGVRMLMLDFDAVVGS